MNDSPLIQQMQSYGRAVPAGLADEFNTARLWEYYRFLEDDNIAGGFFSKSDSDRIFDRHLYESVLFAKYACQEYYVATGRPVSRETEILDAGSGPGLPGYIFACRQDRPRITLLDSSRRRLGRLEAFVLKHYPDDVPARIRFLYRRAEELTGSFPLIVSRALIPFPSNVELLSHLQSPGGILILWAPGTPPSAPRAKKLTDYLERLGYVSRETVPLPELNFLGHREIIVLKKQRESRKGYPRNWKQIKDSIPEWKEVE